jgi:hypothetical protein
VISDILKQLPRLKEDDLSILFNNKSQVIQLKLQSQRIIIYFVDNQTELQYPCKCKK